MIKKTCWLVEGAGFSSNLLVLSKEPSTAYIDVYSWSGERINNLKLDLEQTERIPAKFLISEQPLRLGLKSSLVNVYSESEIIVRNEYFFNESCFSLSDLEYVPVITKFYPFNLSHGGTFLIFLNNLDREIKLTLRCITATRSPEKIITVKPCSNEIINISQEFIDVFQDYQNERGYLRIQSADPYYLQFFESSEREYSEFYSMMG